MRKDYGQNAAFVHGLAGGVLEWLDAKAAEHILDLGCGDGQLTLRIAATGASVVGVDTSAEMVASARARGVVAEVANAEVTPFRRNEHLMLSFPTRFCTGCAIRTP